MCCPFIYYSSNISTVEVTAVSYAKAAEKGKEADVAKQAEEEKRVDEKARAERARHEERTKKEECDVMMTDKKTDEVIRGGMRGVIASVTALLVTIPPTATVIPGSWFLAGSLKAGHTKLIIMFLQVP